MLSHFLAAQEPVYAEVLAELRASDKRTHWMWFIFPQLTALGRSPMARRFGIDDLAAARAYLAHPVLGARLRECVAIVIGVEGRSAQEIFGEVDALKFCSSLTLFEAAAEPAAATLFAKALTQYYTGSRDPLTLSRISGQPA